MGEGVGCRGQQPHPSGDHKLWIKDHKNSSHKLVGTDTFNPTNPIPQAQRSCLRRLVALLCEGGQEGVALICGTELPYGTLGSAVGEELRFKAEQSPLVVLPGVVCLYSACFAFHVARSDYRSAAAAMHSKAGRVRGGSPTDLPTLRAWTQSLAMALGAMHMLPPGDAWLEQGEGNREEVGGADAFASSPRKKLRKLPCLEDGWCRLEEVAGQHALSVVALQVALRDPSLTAVVAAMSPHQVLRAVSRVGVYEAGLAMVGQCWEGSDAHLHLASLFEDLTRSCVEE